MAAVAGLAYRHSTARRRPALYGYDRLAERLLSRPFEDNKPRGSSPDLSLDISWRQAPVPWRSESFPLPLTSEDPFGAAIAVLVPCHNEEAAIQTVVRDFRAALPAATIYVYDNNSSDHTSDMA